MSNITKKAIAESFKKLIEVKSVPEITIQDITSSCGLNRQTFYYHFKDIYDLIEWIFEDDLQTAVGSHKTISNWNEGYQSLFNYCLKNKNFIIYTYNSISRKQVEQFLYKVAYSFLYKVISLEAKNYRIREEDLIYITHFYKYVFVGFLCEWIDSNMSVKPDIIIEKLNKMIQGTVKSNLEKFSY